MKIPLSRIGHAELLRRAAAEAVERGERVLICCASEASAEAWADVPGVEVTYPGRKIVGDSAVYVVDEVDPGDETREQP